MNLSQYVKTIQIFQSTGTPGTTGDALAESTGGSTGTGASTSGPGGFPFASTGVDLRGGFEAVRFTASVSGYTTGGGAGSSGIFTLQAYMAPSSTSAPTAWVAIKDAYALAYATGPAALVVDVYRPKITVGPYTAVGAIVQAPSSSAIAYSIVADVYGAKKYTVAQSTAIAAWGSTNQGSTAFSFGPVLSVNGTS